MKESYNFETSNSRNIEQKSRRAVKTTLIQGAIWLTTLIATAQVLSSEEGEKKIPDSKPKGDLKNIYFDANLTKGDNVAEHMYNIAFPATIGIQTEEKVKGNFEVNIPHVYGEDFETVATTEEGEERKEEMTRYIEEKLKETFGNEVRKSIFPVEFFETTTFKNFQKDYPEQAKRILEYNHLTPTKIKITGSSSPEAVIHGPKSLIPGNIEQENLDLAKKRAQNPVIIEALKKAGIEIDESVPISYESVETQFTDADIDSLTHLAIDNKYLDKDENKEEKILKAIEILVSDYSTDKLKGTELEKALDSIVGDKRYVVVSLEFETEQSETYFMPIPITLFLLSLAVHKLLNRKRKKEEEPPKVPDRESTLDNKEMNVSLHLFTNNRIFSERFQNESESALPGIPHGREGFEILYDGIVHGKKLPDEIAQSVQLSGAGGISDIERIQKTLLQDEFEERFGNHDAKKRGLDYVDFTEQMYKAYMHEIFSLTSESRVKDYFKKIHEEIAQGNSKFDSEEAFGKIDLVLKHKDNNFANKYYEKVASELAKTIGKGYMEFLSRHPEIEKRIPPDHSQDRMLKGMIKDYEKPMLKSVAPKGYPHEGTAEEKLAFLRKHFRTGFAQPAYITTGIDLMKINIERMLQKKRSEYQISQNKYETLKEKDPMKALMVKDTLEEEKYTMASLQKDIEKEALFGFGHMVGKCPVPMLDLLPESKEKYLKNVTEDLLERWQKHDRSFDLEEERNFDKTIKKEGVDPLSTALTGQESVTTYVEQKPNSDIVRRHMRMTGTPIKEDELKEALLYENDPQKILWSKEMVHILEPVIESVFRDRVRDTPHEHVIVMRLLKFVEDLKKKGSKVESKA